MKPRSKYDGCVFEMEHNPWDSGRLRDCLQYMLNRAQIAKARASVPPVTPMVRIPVNGVEMAQWQARQAFDVGSLRRRVPRISTVEEAANAVGACRYPRLKSATCYEPVGIRGDGPTAAVRYWGLVAAGLLQEGRRLAAQPRGRDLRHPADRGHRGVENLDAMLTKVPGIGAILIGEGDPRPGARHSPAVRASELLKWMEARGRLPARSTTSSSATRTSRPAMSNASSAKATATMMAPMHESTATSRRRRRPRAAAKAHRRPWPRSNWSDWAAWAAPSGHGSSFPAQDRDAAAMVCRANEQQWKRRRIPAPSPMAPAAR